MLQCRLHFVVIPEKENATTDTTSHIQEQTTMREQSTLIPNEAEAFALEPIDVTNCGKFQTVLINSIKSVPFCHILS